jgi:hypothetical protein
MTFPPQTERPWVLWENYGPGEEPAACGRYSTEEAANKAAMYANLSSAPVEPGDIWGPDYYVTREESA